MDSTSTFMFMVYARLAHIGEDRRRVHLLSHYYVIGIPLQGVPLTTDTTSPATADGAPLEHVPG